MPSISRIVENMEKDGPTLDIYFSIPSEREKILKEQNKPIPEPIHCEALIDTGASHCAIQTDIPKKLGLNPVGQGMMNTPSHQSVPCYVYFLKMTVKPNNLVYEGNFTSADLGGQKIDCLIGRDALSQAHFTYIGYLKQFTLSI